MKTFVTGGSGFIGQYLLRILDRRGFQVKALVRSHENARVVRMLGAEAVWGDVTQKESMRAGMLGQDVVFHLAGWYKLGARDQRHAEITNVKGTRNVLSLAHELGIPKIIYTSTVSVFGDTGGFLPDETYASTGETLVTEYDRTKWTAHFQVAKPLIDEGAPIIILLPGAVYGPGDHSLIGDFMKAFLLGFFPVLPGPELTLTLAHVEDIAEAHALAAEKGRPGESYVISEAIADLGQLAELWARLSDQRVPRFYIPARFIKPLAPVIGGLSRLVPLPSLVSEDTLSILGVSYIARSDKARMELGWHPRSLEAGMRQTLSETSQDLPKFNLLPRLSSRQEVAAITLVVALGLIAAWLLSRRNRRKRR